MTTLQFQRDLNKLFNLNTKGGSLYTVLADRRIEGKTYRIRTTINESGIPKNSVVPHSYEATEIELLPEGNSSGLEPTVSPQKAEAPHGAAKILKDVEKSYVRSGEIIGNYCLMKARRFF